MSAQFEDKHGLKFFLIFWNMHLGSMTSERLQCPNSLVAEVRRQGTGSFGDKMCCQKPLPSHCLFLGHVCTQILI